MDQAKSLVSIHCSEHKSQLIGALDTDPKAKQLGYCYKCIIGSHKKGTFPQDLKTFDEYLQETSDFYKKCCERVQNADEPPAEYKDELSKKAERLEKLSKHIDDEKQRVKERFGGIRKNVLQILDMKEKECLQLLEGEISGLSEVYTHYEKLLATGWMKFSDIDVIYPTADVLEQKISKIANMDQLQAFVKGVTEDIQIEKMYCDGEDGLKKRKYRINYVITCFKKHESSLPRLQGELLNTEDLESFMKEQLKGLSQQEIKVENSIALRMGRAHCGSEIINEEQYEVLKSWLSQYKDFNLTLLYRGSVDGMSAPKFHEKCDGKGATVTLIKCRFEGATHSSVIGGFVDQSWHSNSGHIASNVAFLFSITSGVAPVKCSIQNNQYASYGGNDYGPYFGGGDLSIAGALKTGNLNTHSYTNTLTISPNRQRQFTIEEIEVFQVK